MCERHFDRNQILTHWDHIIDGKLCQLEREKPKIKPDAVPYMNLPDSENDISIKTRKRTAKNKAEPKRRKQNLTNSGQNEKVCNFYGYLSIYIESSYNLSLIILKCRF